MAPGRRGREVALRAAVPSCYNAAACLPVSYASSPPPPPPRPFPESQNRRPKMRCRWMSLPAVLLGGLVALAQQPGQPPPPAPLDPVNNKLDGILVNWERAMSGISTLYTQVKRTATDKVFLSNEVFDGEARYVK